MDKEARLQDGLSACLPLGLLTIKLREVPGTKGEVIHVDLGGYTGELNAQRRRRERGRDP